MNKRNEVKRIRSATAPTTRPGVIIANISWKSANKVKGIVGPKLHGAPEFTPSKNKLDVGSPINPPIDFPKHKPYSTTIQRTVTTPAATTLLIIVEITFLRCTIPP